MPREMVQIRPVQTSEELAQTATLAHKIWNEHFVPIIGHAQVDYMLATFQSETAIREQIGAGYRYFLVVLGTTPVGYFALITDRETGLAQLSKLYIRKQQRRRGLARHAVAWAEQLCRKENSHTLWLAVNRHNRLAIDVYRALGFRQSGECKADIGEGFFMDDYTMSKEIASAPPGPEHGGAEGHADTSSDTTILVEPPLGRELLTGVLIIVTVSGALLALCLVLS